MLVVAPENWYFDRTNFKRSNKYTSEKTIRKYGATNFIYFAALSLLLHKNLIYISHVMPSIKNINITGRKILSSNSGIITN